MATPTSAVAGKLVRYFVQILADTSVPEPVSLAPVAAPSLHSAHVIAVFAHRQMLTHSHVC